MGVIVAKEYTRDHPSPEYIEAVRLGRHYHETKKVFTGKHSYQSYAILRKLCQTHGTKDILDWGSGKNVHLQATDIRLLINRDDEVKQVFSSWKSALGVDDIFPYDPCVAGHDVLPDRTFGGVMSVDVLQYIPTVDLTSWVLDTMFSFASQWVYAVFPLYNGKKVLADGSNAHKTIQGLEWWVDLWVKTGRKYPDIVWETRMEIAQPPISHRRFCGKGEVWQEAAPWWRIWKPNQLLELTKKQREEMEMIARSQHTPIPSPAFGENHSKQ